MIKQEICLVYKEHYFIFSKVQIVLQEIGDGMGLNSLVPRVVSEVVMTKTS